MNPLQRAIAAAAGLDDVIETAQEQVSALSAREEEYQGQIEELAKAQEQIYSDYTLVQRQLEDLQFIDWSTGLPGDSRDEIISDKSRLGILRRVRILRHENPLAKQAIKISLRFVFGKNVTFQAENQPDQDTLLAVWGDSQNHQVFTGRDPLINWFDEEWTDGERFMVMVKSEEEPWVRFTDVPVEQITEILYDPGNRGVPVWYKRVFKRSRYDANANQGQGAWTPLNNGSAETRYYRDFRVTDTQLADIESRGLFIPERKIGEGVIKHMMINSVRNERGVRRGISELFASRRWFDIFRVFMEDRNAINAAANALAIQRKVKGGPAGVARVTGAIGGVQPIPDGSADNPMSAFAMRRLTRPLPGSIVDTTDNIDYRSIRLDTGAPNAVQDARMFLIGAGAGMGIPINYLGETSSSLAGAQTVELPLIKMFEDHQSAVKGHLQDIADYVISVRDGEDFKPNAVRIAWEFPPIVTADLVKWITAFAQFSQQVAPGNSEVRRIGIKGGLTVLNVANPDIEMDKIMAEEAEIKAQKEKQQQLQLDAQQKALEAPAVPPGGAPFGGNGAKPPPANGNGKGPDGGQKAGGGPQPNALGPDTMRLTRGRPPRELTTGPRTNRQ